MENEVKKQRKLFRSRSDRYIAGVCGGLGEYFNIDSNIVRIIFVVLAFMGGIGVILYLAGLIIVPENPTQEAKPKKRTDSTFFWAMIFIVIGFILLFKELGIFYYFNIWHIPWSLVWAMFLIGIGILLIFSQSRREKGESTASSEPGVAEEAPEKSEEEPPFKIYRSRDDRMVAGVCGGLGKYFNIDPSLVRLGWVLASLASIGLGIIVYILMIIIFPEEPTSQAV